MTGFLWTMLVLTLLGILRDAGRLAEDKPWPKSYTVSCGVSMLSLNIGVGFVIWISILLFGL